MVGINHGRKKRQGGPGRVPVSNPRHHCVSVRLNDEELAQLDRQRGAMARGEWLRCAALDKLPPVVPEPNQQKWAELARHGANLNQIARHLNAGGGADAAEIRVALDDYRVALLGVSP